MDVTPFPRPIERLQTRDAGVVGLRSDLDQLPSVELLDEYAVLLALPPAFRDASALRLTLIRDILLDRLGRAS
jgi:hypothetical protein